MIEPTRPLLFLAEDGARRLLTPQFLAVEHSVQPDQVVRLYDSEGRVTIANVKHPAGVMITPAVGAQFYASTVTIDELIEAFEPLVFSGDKPKSG